MKLIFDIVIITAFQSIKVKSGIVLKPPHLCITQMYFPAKPQEQHFLLMLHYLHRFPANTIQYCYIRYFKSEILERIMSKDNTHPESKKKLNIFPEGKPQSAPTIKCMNVSCVRVPWAFLKANRKEEILEISFNFR